MVKRYIPERGDIVLLSFDPQSGKEQAGTRPALVISPKTYNEKVGLALFCPITTKIKGYPFEVLIDKPSKIRGVVLADHVKNFDWVERKAKFLEKSSNKNLSEVVAKLALLIY